VVPNWYRAVPMNVNVKNLEPEVIARLAEQAAAEGMSQQEWIRQSLRRTAARLSPAELSAQRAEISPMGDSEFAELRSTVTRRRRAAVERLGASQRRR
jgi:hypothetical protein